MDKEQLDHLYDAMLAARKAIYDAKEKCSLIPDSAVAMPVMSALQQQMDALGVPIEQTRRKLIALSQQ